MCLTWGANKILQFPDCYELDAAGLITSGTQAVYIRPDGGQTIPVLCEKFNSGVVRMEFLTRKDEAFDFNRSWAGKMRPCMRGGGFECMCVGGGGGTKDFSKEGSSRS